MLQALLGSAGLTTDDVQIVEYPDYTQRIAVDQGAVDAATGFRTTSRSSWSWAANPATVLHIDDITALPGPGPHRRRRRRSRRNTTRSRRSWPLRSRPWRRSRRTRASGLDAAIVAVPELAADRAGQAAVLAATIDSWTGPVQAQFGLGAIDSNGWIDSIAYMTTLGLVAEAGGHGGRSRAHGPAARRRLTVVLGGVRPSGERRSWWLREALAAEERPAPHLAGAAPPLRGTTTADVVILGGGYTGLWTAYRLTEIAPGARIVLLEQDICGGGPSGRNGGFATGWWDELPTLIERHGEVGAVAIARAMDEAVDSLGVLDDAEHGVDAWYRKAGSISASAAPAQDDGWVEAVEACRAAGEPGAYVALTPDEVRARVASPVLRGGAFMPGAATVQPAFLARGLRRVVLERGVEIHEGTTVTELDGERPGWLGSVGSGARRPIGGRPCRATGPGPDDLGGRRRARSRRAPRSWRSTPGPPRGRGSGAGS